jgi:DNA-binding transcriptional MerR regulator
MGELPPKLFFRIGEVAGLVGVEPHVLRYWEREFRSIRPTKSAKGQRVYSRKDVENLIRVRELLYRDGFTIAGAKKKLQRPTDEPDAATEKEIDGETPAPAPVVKPAVRAPAAVAVSAPMAPAPPPPRTREKLLALRAEVEAFLEELTPRAR